MGFTDYHSHILPGQDDGAADIRESLRMAAILAAAGFRTVHCTPHRLVGRFEVTPAQVAAQVATLQRAVDAAGIPVRLVPGMEYYLDEFLLFNLKEPLPLGSSSVLLVEAPLQKVPPAVERTLAQVMASGFRPLIAHPERCLVFFPPGKRGAAGLGLRRALRGLFSRKDPSPSAVQPDRTLLERLGAAGCLFQADIASFAGEFGDEIQLRAVTLLEMGIYANLGSDAHRAEGLAETLRRGLRVIEETVGKAALLELLK